MVLLKIGNIEINFQILIAFLAGIGVGFLLLLLLYVYAVIKSMNKKMKRHHAQEEDIDESEIKWLIADAQKQFKDKKLRKEVGAVKRLLDLSKELSIDIAEKFYPDSKYPYLELTIDEALMLSHYVTDRIDELLNSKIIKLFRGITLRRIMEFNDAKVKAEKTKVVKQAKRIKLGKIAKVVSTAVNILNPVTWVKRLAIGPTVNLIVLKISLSIIAITGEETYKIYSKKVFHEEKEITTDMEDIYQSIIDEELNEE